MSDDNVKPPSAFPEPVQSYAEHFGTIRTLGDLTRDPENRPWLTTVPKDAPRRKYVVWLGCNILRTAHIAESLDDILNHLQTDFAMLGGPSNCCGIVHQGRGDVAVAKNMRGTPQSDLTDTAKQRIRSRGFWRPRPSA